MKEITIVCSMYLCSKSFPMCQWQITFTDCHHALQQPPVWFLLRWMWNCSVLCRPLLDHHHTGGAECPVKHRGNTKAHQPLVLSVCPRVLCPPSPASLQGWERRFRLSFILVMSSFQRTERGEESTDPHSSVCLSIQPERTHRHSCSIQVLNQAARQTVNKAARLSRQPFLSDTVLQGLTARSVSSL